MSSNLVGACRGYQCECVSDTSASVAKFHRRPHTNPSSVGTADRLPTDIPTDGFVGKCAKREKNCCKYTLPLSHTPSVGVSAGAWGCARVRTFQPPFCVLHVSRARGTDANLLPFQYGKIPGCCNNHPCVKPMRPEDAHVPQSPAPDRVGSRPERAVSAPRKADRPQPNPERKPTQGDRGRSSKIGDGSSPEGS